MQWAKTKNIISILNYNKSLFYKRPFEQEHYEKHSMNTVTIIII